ncbi:PqqD family protein [Phocaeicola oris]|uniref:PqqD family protein n=2 Tax=Phocaeicola TaxID=909656 RepID=UPI00234F4F26|nr:PqqD family protein [Phocaeicola oris]MCE2617333.1 PqqD family protein [Phocaeicola oris]
MKNTEVKREEDLLQHSDRNNGMNALVKRKYQLPIAYLYNVSPEKTVKSPADMTEMEFGAFVEQIKQLENEVVYRINPDLVERRIGNEWILVPTGAFAQYFNGMITQNDISHFLWSQFRQPTAVGKVIEIAKREYEGSQSIMELQIRQLVESYRKAGLLIEV